MSKISVIVPIYNSEKYLNKCLDSLVNQTFKDIEIVLVNDGSTDGSEEIIKDYLEKDDRIIYFKQPNGGQASARNLGLSKASGEYISFLDSDDFMDNESFKKISDCLKDNDIILCDYYITAGGKDKYVKMYDGSTRNVSSSEYWKFDAGPCNKIYKRDFLLRSHFAFPEGIIYEDYASIPTLIKYNPKLCYSSNALFHYVQDDASTMRSNIYKKKYEDIFEATNYLYNNLIGCGYDKELESIISLHFLYFGSLNFYRFKKYNQIDKISDFMKDKFPRWSSNEYVKEFEIKKRLLMKLFYLKQYNTINFLQKVKKIIDKK